MNSPLRCPWPTGVVARLATACLAAGVFALPASAATPLTLPEAARLAVEQAPTLEARRAGIAAAQAESVRAGALPDPMLAVGVDNWPVTGSDAFDSSAEEMTMKKIGLRQELPARAKRRAERVLAARGVDQAHAESRAERLAVQRAAAEAWIGLWAAQRERDVLRTLREESAVAASVSRARFASGRNAAADALAAEAAVLEVDSRLEAAHASVAAAQAALARWTGGADVEAGDAPDFRLLSVPEARLLASSDGIGSLLPVTAQVEAAAARIDVARAQRRPNWSVAASYGQRGSGRSDLLMLEVAIGLPLFPRDRQDREVAAREADYRAALATREDLRREAAARIRADLARWEGLKRQVALDERSLLPLARDRAMTALAAYRGGGDLQPWLAARRDELAAHLTHVGHLAELGRAWAALNFLFPGEEPR